MYSFEITPDRKGKNSVKWDKYHGKDIIPLWIADTDFSSPEQVKLAIQRRAMHGVYGYEYPSQSLKQLFIDRMKDKYNWSLQLSDIIFTTGTVPSLSLCCEAFGGNKDKVLIQSPSYPPIAQAPNRFEKASAILPMVSRHGRWQIDFSKLESVMEQGIKILLLCNPHNPTGAVLSQSELITLAQYVEHFDMTVISDEIHCDLILEPYLTHIPFASLSEAMRTRTITLMGPSKAFNLAGLGCSVAVIENPELRRRFQEVQVGVMAGVNVFGLTAAEAAYQYGEPWLQKQIQYLRGNRDFLYKELNALTGVEMLCVEATYLAWVNISKLQLTDPERYFEQYGVGISGGEAYGDKRFIRINFGCSRDLLRKAVERIKQAVDNANKRIYK